MARSALTRQTISISGITPSAAAANVDGNSFDNVRGVPTFLVFDGQGNLIERQVGFPDQGKIKALIAGG